MNTILVWKEQMQIIYAKYSLYIMIAMKFIMGLFVFGAINSNIGFMKKFAGTASTVGAAAICSILPLIVMTLVATAFVLIHLYSLSLGVMIIAAVCFLLIYIFYFRFAAKSSWLLLLTAFAFSIKMPIIIPVAVGLLGTPAFFLAPVFGTFVYYLLHMVRTSSSTLKADSINKMIEVSGAFAKQLFTNKEMWLMIAVVLLSVLLVYFLRTRSFDHSWKIATVSGVVVAVVVGAIGNVTLNVHIQFGMYILSAALAIAVGLLLEILFLSVDYTRSEYVEFEDDEYHYYVKAIPKYAVTAPHKSVKHITEKNTKEKKQVELQNVNDAVQGKRERIQKVTPEKKRRQENDAEDILLTRSLNSELGLQSLEEKGK